MRCPVAVGKIAAVKADKDQTIATVYHNNARKPHASVHFLPEV
jgi:hypothetical protein